MEIRSRIKPELLDKVRLKAEELNISISALVKMALVEYLKKQ